MQSEQAKIQDSEWLLHFSYLHLHMARWNSNTQLNKKSISSCHSWNLQIIHESKHTRTSQISLNSKLIRSKWPDWPRRSRWMTSIFNTNQGLHKIHRQTDGRTDGRTVRPEGPRGRNEVLTLTVFRPLWPLYLADDLQKINRASLLYLTKLGINFHSHLPIQIWVFFYDRGTRY